MKTWYQIVGTSHISSQAVKSIKQAFDEYQPDAVAIEIDSDRLAGLLSKERSRPSISMIRVVGVKGYLFAMIGGSLQRRLGRLVGVSPGVDMLSAVRLAQRNQKHTLLIDRHIAITLQRLNKVLGWREFKQFCKDLWRGLRGKETISFDIRAIPDEKAVETLLGEFAKRYPGPFAVLVAERNHYMVRALRIYHAQHPEHKVLVVVGAGHVAGMRELLEEKVIS